MKTNIHFLSYLVQFFLEWEMFQRNVVEKIKTRILGSVIFFSRKSCLFLDNMNKFCRTGKATDEIIAPAHCMLDA
jgi:hypothetical protein